MRDAQFGGFDDLGIDVLRPAVRRAGETVEAATVCVERDPALNPDDCAAFDADLKDRIRKKLRNDTSVTFDVEVLAPNTLERALSKARRVDDQRPRYRPS